MVSPDRAVARRTRVVLVLETAAMALVMGLEFGAQPSGTGGRSTVSAIIWSSLGAVALVSAIFFVLTAARFRALATPRRALAFHAAFAFAVGAVLCASAWVHSAASTLAGRAAVLVLLAQWIHGVAVLCIPVLWPCVVAVLALMVAATHGALFGVWRVPDLDAGQCLMASVPAAVTLLFAARRSERMRRRDFVALSLLEARHSEILQEERRFEVILSDILPSDIAVRLRDSRKIDRALLAGTDSRLPTPSASAGASAPASAPAPSASSTSATPMEAVIADTYRNATIAFIVLDGLGGLAPEKLVELLGQLFAAFDGLAMRFESVLKIKTMGTGIMFAAGIPNSHSDSALHAVSLCTKMRIHVRRIASRSTIAPDLSLRAGLSTGTAVGGVIGRNKPKFDIWGDAVNVSARLMQNCPPWGIQITEETRGALPSGTDFTFEESRVIAKGKGELKTFLVAEDIPLESPLPSLSVGASTCIEPVTPVSATATLRDIITQKALPKSQIATSRDFSQVPQRRDSGIAHAQNRATLQFRDEAVEAQWKKHYHRQETMRRSVRVQLVIALLAISAVSVFDYFFSENTAKSARAISFIGCFFWFVPAVFAFFSALKPVRRLIGHVLAVCALAGDIFIQVLMYNSFFARMPGFLIASPVLLHLLGCSPFLASSLVSGISLPISFAANAVSLHGNLYESLTVLAFVVLSSGSLHYLLERQMRLKFSLTLLLRKESERLAKEEAATKDLLLSILPESVLDRLAASSRAEVIAQSVPEATVVVADIAGFTAMCSRMPAYDVVRLLDELFSRIDEIISMHNLEKLKTLGDCYIAVSNVSVPNDQHASDSVAAGLDMLAAVRVLNLRKSPEDRLTIRIGVHTGPVLAGVIQTKSYIFDCWGETMAIAEKLQETSAPNMCHVSKSTWERTQDKFPYQQLPPLVFRDSEISTYSLASSIVVTATLGGFGDRGHQKHVSVVRAKGSKNAPAPQPPDLDKPSTELQVPDPVPSATAAGASIVAPTPAQCSSLSPSPIHFLSPARVSSPISQPQPLPPVRQHSIVQSIGSSATVPFSLAEELTTSQKLRKKPRSKKNPQGYQSEVSFSSATEDPPARETGEGHPPTQAAEEPTTAKTTTTQTTSTESVQK